MADGIEMTRINSGTDGYDNKASDGVFYLSPDRRKALAVLRRGNLSTGQNDYRLVMFDMHEIRRFLGSHADNEVAERPAYETLVQFSTGAPTYAIERVKWQPDSRTVLFIGRSSNEKGQVYSLDVFSQALRQLTQHPENVVGYDIAADEGVLVYAAEAPPEDWSQRNSRGYTLTSHTQRDLTLKDPRETAPRYVQQYVLNLRTHEVRATQLPRDIYAQPVSIAPGGGLAVARVQVRGYPADWRDYDFIEREIDAIERVRGPAVAALADEADEAFNAFPSFTISQYYSVDLKTGAARPLLDAPALAFEPFALAWSEDERSVVVAPTFLPLIDVDAAERRKREHVQVVADVDLASGRATRIADVDGYGAVQLKRMTDGALEVGQSTGTGPTTTLRLRRLKRKSGAWIERAKSEARVSAQDESVLTLAVEQDANTPPEIAAIDARTGRTVVLTDLNPQLRDVALGSVETFTWQDRLKRTHVGGLVKPPEYEPGRHYPVVVQTYGFYPDRFMVEGPPLASKAVFAARALAGKDIIVLQMPDESGADSGPSPYRDTGENPKFIAMLESAIDALDQSDLIDRSRVGLVGFSRSGMHVLSAITFCIHPIAAATVADSIADTPMSYARMLGNPSAAMTEWERPSEMGAPFWGEGIKLWMERSTAFHLDRIRTPLRLEAYATGADPRWDTYALLKRFRRPVEFIQIPNGRHVLTNPLQVHTSQQGNVDWYAFWLKGEEDPDPAKRDQYTRWRELRAEHEAHLADLKARGESAILPPPYN